MSPVGHTVEESEDWLQFVPVEWDGADRRTHQVYRHV